MHGLGWNGRPLDACRRVLKSFSLSNLASPAFAATMKHTKTDFSFVQISDSHIGFNKPANPDVIGKLKAAVDKINALHSPK